MDLLSGWYPGMGEVVTIRRMSPFVQEFIRDASCEYDGFVSEYLVPVLDGYACPEDKIVSDIALAVYVVECERAGLGEYDYAQIPLGELGGVLSKIKKAVKKVVHKVIAPVKKVAEKVIPKPILNVMKKGAAAITKIHKQGEKVVEKVEHVAGQIGKKYGNVIIGAAGAILAPFTGGLSLAAAAALTTANTAYQKKRAADRAKKEAKKEAGQLVAEAQQQQDVASRQLDDFYSQNQQWFAGNGVTPDRWGQMSFDQRVQLLQSGMSGGSAPAPAPLPQVAAPPAGGGYAPPAPSGGGSSPTPGGGGGGGGGGESFSPYSQPTPKVATAGMFDSSMLPVLAAGAALALIFGKPAKGGGRRARRNPSRHHRRVA